MHNPGVLVTDGNERSTLAVTRSLGGRGIAVFVGAETAVSLAGSSRHCAGTFVYPSPWRDPRGYVDRLIAVATERHAAALLPTTDIAMELVSERLGEFPPGMAAPIPSLEQYHRLSDKYRLTSWSEEAGIPVPPTIYVPDGRIEDVVAGIQSWPVVIKPGRSLLKHDGRWRKSGVLIARDAAELRKLYHDHWFLKYPSLIQGFVSGHGEGVFGLFEQGKPVALFAHRRLRERPPSGGVSTLREAIPLPEAATSHALKIMEDAKWDGVAMVEFKVDPTTGTPYLMEVNGRFWGSLQLAIDAGVDFPWLLYQRIGGAGGEEHPADYRHGVRSQWWLGDLDHLAARLKGAKDTAAPSASRQSLLGTFASLVNVFARDTKNETLRASDPGPGLFELKAYASGKVASLGRKASGFFHRRFDRLSVGLANAGLRLGRHRRDLERRLPAKIDSILVLCRGNICRSPFVDVWLQDRLAERRLPIRVRSAGLDAIPDREAFPMAKTVAPEFGIDLSAHRAAMVTQEMADDADLILVMEPEHTRQLSALLPGVENKTFLFGHFPEKQPVTVIADPYGGTADRFRACYRELIEAGDGLLARLTMPEPPHRSS